MGKLLRWLGVARLFARVSDKALFGLALLFTLLFGADLLWPFDGIPLLDEAALGILSMGALSELHARRQRRSLAGGLGAAAAPGDTAGSRGPRVYEKRLREDARELEKMAQKRGLTGLDALVRDLDEKLESLAEHERFLARRDNDPWGAERRVAALERAVAEAEAEGEARRLDDRRRELDAARIHGRGVSERARQRDREQADLVSVQAQVEALLLALQADGKGRPLAGLAASLDAPGLALHPAIARAWSALRERSAAERELEEAVARRRREAGRGPPGTEAG